MEESPAVNCYYFLASPDWASHEKHLRAANQTMVDILGRLGSETSPLLGCLPKIDSWKVPHFRHKLVPDAREVNT